MNTIQARCSVPQQKGENVINTLVELTTLSLPLQTYFRTRQSKRNKANLLHRGSFPMLHHKICWTEAEALVLGSGVHTEIWPVMTQFSAWSDASTHWHWICPDSMSAARICSTICVACCLAKLDTILWRLQPDPAWHCRLNMCFDSNFDVPWPYTTSNWRRFRYWCWE